MKARYPQYCYENKEKNLPVERIAILGDQHARFEDSATIEAVNHFLVDFQPDVIINNGDLVDFTALGTYRKSLGERASMSEDVVAAQSILWTQRQLFKDARIILVEGNHEERLQRYLLDNAAELADMKALTIPRILNLADYDVEYLGPYGQGFDWHGVFIYHGTRLSPHSAYTARAEYGDTGTSGVSGHVHRLGAHYVTDRAGEHVWLEGGCLCNLDGDNMPPSYRGPRIHNWQQGFTVGYWTGARWTLYQVPITGHQFIWDGEVYKP